MPSDRDDLAEYWLYRRAFRDAIWDVIGTIVMLVFVWVLFVVGVSILLSGLQSVDSTTGLLVAAFGFVLMAGAVVAFMRELRVYPFD